MVGMSIVTHAQECNKYLIKPKKIGSSMYYYTNPKLLGDYYDDQILVLDLDRHPQKPQIVYVNLDVIDFALAGIEGTVPDDMVFNTYHPQRIGVGLINTYGKFFVPPFYTQVQKVDFRYVMGDYERYILLGRKLKNGNWQALTFDNDYEEERIFNELPEQKDYTLLTRNVIIFTDRNNKYGLIDFTGKIQVEAAFDTIYADFIYQWFPKNSTTQIRTGQSDTKLPESLESAFNKMSVKYNGNLEGRDYKNGAIIIYLMKNEESMVLFSDTYITKPIKNATLTKHEFKDKDFFLLTGKDGDYDIIDLDGTSMDDKLKYAYFETIHRDTSGIERDWAFDPAKDYSKPYRLVNYDSIKLAEIKKKEAEEVLKNQQNKEAAAQRELLEKDPTNYSTILAGNYDITEFTDDNRKLEKTGYNYETNLNSSWTKKNKADLSINFKGMFYRTDAQFHTFDIDIAVRIQKGVVGEGSFNVGQGKVDGYILSADADMILPGSAFTSVRGTYNPFTREIYIVAVKTSGGTITIRGVKTRE